MTPEQRKELTPTAEQVAQWEREARELYPVDPYKSLNYFDNYGMDKAQKAHINCRRRAWEEQGERIQWLEQQIADLKAKLNDPAQF